MRGCGTLICSLCASWNFEFRIWSLDSGVWSLQSKSLSLCAWDLPSRLSISKAREGVWRVGSRHGYGCEVEGYRGQVVGFLVGLWVKRESGNAGDLVFDD